MIWMLSPETPKCAAALTASAANCASEGRLGAFAELSSQVPPSGLAAGWPTGVPAPLHWVVPLATPSQYWVCEVKKVSPLPYACWKNDCCSAASPEGSLVTVVPVPHWLPQ